MRLILDGSANNNLAIAVVLSVGFTLASVLGYFAQRFRLSPIVGYLLAGCLIGPYSPVYAVDSHLAEQLAEIGVILMMFGVGLHFKWQDLLNVRHIAIPGAIIQSVLATLVGYGFMHLMGWTSASALLIGISISVASTVVLVRVLKDNYLLKTQQGHIAVGWLIVEDVLTVAALIFLPTLAAFTSGESISIGFLIKEAAFIILKFVALAAFALTIGSAFLNKALESVARTRSQELFTLGILASIFAITIGSSLLFGTSIALGAFVSGMVIGKSQLHYEASAQSLPIQSAFVALFFISVGMLLNPQAILHHPGLFLGLLSIVMLIKPLIAVLIARFFNQSIYGCLVIGLSLAQIGEFSFILAEEGLRFNLLPELGYDLLVSCALVSIALNPILFSILKRYRERLKEYTPHPSHMVAEHIKTSDKKAVVIGYGLSGRKATSMLLEQGFSVIVIDSNIDSITHLENEGHGRIHPLYGDATQIILLEHAQLEQAQLVVITAADIQSTKLILSHVREFNPDIRVLARVNYQKDRALFEQLKVDIVCNEQEAVNAFEKAITDLASGVLTASK